VSQGAPNRVPNKDFFEKEARTRVREGDLFSFENPVIPVMTRGRAYGTLSRRVFREGHVIPDLGHHCAVFQAPYIYVALWDGETGGYTAEGIFDVAAACMGVAAKQKLKRLVMPMFGGNEAYKYLWAAERGIFEQSDFLDSAGFDVPDHIYVTDKIVT
jgi:hypothetical protein